MTKDESLILKGIAILLMIFHHLFCQYGNTQLCSDLIISGKPLAHILTSATNPVAFFCFLSGYGLYFIYKNKGIDKNRWLRIFKIYKYWWISLVFFTIIAYLYNGNNYYSNIGSVIYNFTAFDTHWYAEGWFILPYVLLSLISPIIFRSTDKINWKYVLLIFFILGTATSFIVSRFGSQYLYNNMLVYNIFLVFHISPAFMFGAMACRADLIARLKERFGHSYWPWLLILFIVVVMCVTHTAAWGPLYCSSFFILFLLAKRHFLIDQALSLFGKHSLCMWFSHCWFCYYIFHDHIYSLKYPILIFVVVTILSLLFSIGINYTIKITNKAKDSLLSYLGFRFE